MKNESAPVRVLLKRSGNHSSESGHPWVYQSEIADVRGSFEPGNIVDVYGSRNHFLGRGYINPRSQIMIRMLSNQRETIDKAFFQRRIQAAWDYRRKFLSEPEYCRLVFSEGDFLPGLVVDKFGDGLVYQISTLGMDRYTEDIVEILDDMFKPAFIYERNDVPSREIEGLAQSKGFVRGNGPTLITVKENGLPFYADIENGQKTGFFYDQRENRHFLSRFVKDTEVLDCFCYTGSFSVHAAAYGAKKVTGVDISEGALEIARRNAELNDVSGTCEFQAANAFDLLRELSDAKKTFDVVILDPPAFTKSRGAIEGAARGYKEINLRGLKLVKPGGYLVTCSCSYHMDRELFKSILVDAAADVRRIVREVAYLGQAKDHPVLLSAPETNYLKFMVLEVQ